MSSPVILAVSQAYRCSRVRLSSLVRGAGLLLDPVAAMTIGAAAVGSLAPFSQNLWAVLSISRDRQHTPGHACFHLLKSKLPDIAVIAQSRDHKRPFFF
jgi:hypothetical protein